MIGMVVEVEEEVLMIEPAPGRRVPASHSRARGRAAGERGNGDESAAAEQNARPTGAAPHRSTMTPVMMVEMQRLLST